jgi:predicted nucleic acid-binding protein
MSLTIDASVWIAAADAGDVFHEASRIFLRQVVADRLPVAEPSFALMEVACVLARRLRDSAQGRQLARTLMGRIVTSDIAVDASFLARAEDLGTRQFLRAADALYSATAQITSSTLVSWDNEHLQRAGAITPATWLAASS